MRLLSFNKKAEDKKKRKFLADSVYYLLKQTIFFPPSLRVRPTKLLFDDHIRTLWRIIRIPICEL